MPKVIPKNAADEMTRPYIDDAVDKQLKAADVPPRNKLDISFKDAGRTDDNKDYESNQDAYEKNHGKLYDMTHKNTIPWRNYVVYLVLLSMLTCVFTFSKYMSGSNGNSTATIARFNVVISGELNKKDFTVNPSSPSITTDALVFEEGVGSVTFDIVVSSTSEVPVNVTVSQDEVAYKGTFDKSTARLEMAEDSSHPQTTKFTYTLTTNQIPSTKGLTPSNGYYTFNEKLNFNVYVEQID